MKFAEYPGLRQLLPRLLLTILLCGALVVAGLLAPAGEGGLRIAGGPFALLPPFLAIAIAIVWRRILVALLLGIFGGALLLSSGNPLVAAQTTAFEFVGATAIDPENLYLFAFTLSLMGMVGVLIKCGGIAGLVRTMARFARGRRSTQATVGVMGTAVFFDDYANSVVVGSSARAITDRAWISREKLAYLVDSTAAPVASVAIISTWIGIEIGLLEAEMGHLSAIANSGYGVFISLIPLRFYCLFTLATVFAVALSGRDFGPMLKAERRAAKGQLMGPNARLLSAAAFQKLAIKEGAPPRAINGWLPIALVLVFILGSFFAVGAANLAGKGIAVSPFSITGWSAAFSAVTGTGLLLTCAGVVGSVAALALALAQGILSWREALGAWIAGARSMLGAVALLILAMTLRKVTDVDHLQLASYAQTVLGGADVLWIPIMVFLVASLIAFSTGTSYGTMGILIPVAVELASRSGDPLILLLATGAVLDGAVFGDHCSPISDTTVLSSVGSSCDHLDHVKTQAPYALLSMLVAASFGYLLLPISGAPLTVVYIGGIVTLVGVIFIIGRRTEVTVGSG